MGQSKDEESSQPSPSDEGVIDPEADPEAAEFVRGLLIRGEAAKAEGGKLPPGVTYEIVEEREGKLPTVRRRRFSAF